MALSKRAQKCVEEYRRDQAGLQVKNEDSNPSKPGAVPGSAATISHSFLLEWFARNGHGPAYFQVKADERHRDAIRKAWLAGLK